MLPNNENQRSSHNLLPQWRRWCSMLCRRNCLGLDSMTEWSSILPVVNFPRLQLRVHSSSLRVVSSNSIVSLPAPAPAQVRHLARPIAAHHNANTLCSENETTLGSKTSQQAKHYEVSAKMSCGMYSFHSWNQLLNCHNRGRELSAVKW